MTLPSVSRDVHFRIADRCVAAKVTQVHADSVDLFVFPPPELADLGGQSQIREGDGNGTWHWPERV
jgi:hypothetical protein